MLYIGIDLGTSAVKLLLMEADGRIRKIVSREYPLYFPHPGWSEQNPADWFAAVTDGIRELVSDCDPRQVRGIGAGGQMHGLVVLDKEDKVIRPAILWNDGRTTAQTGYLNQKVGRDRLRQYTGNIAFAGFTAPKLLWMKENEPELFGRIDKIMLPKDYINYMLTGVHCTDYSDASGTLLLDVRNKCWSKEMLAICGVSQRQLPRLFESYETVGTLKPEIAEVLGLPASGRDRNRNRLQRRMQHFAWYLRNHFYRERSVSPAAGRHPLLRARGRKIPPDGLHAQCGILQQMVHG